MGLNFRGSQASWSYSGFNSFRRDIAATIGIELNDMEGFKHDAGPPRKWSEVIDDIKPLLEHSDCEGEMPPQDCLKVAPRLRQLIPKLSDNYDRRMAAILADDMERLAKEGKALVFI